MVIAIISMVISLINISILIYIYLILSKKESLLNTPQELCANLSGDDFEKCYKNMLCIQNIQCDLQGQPANRGETPSNVDIGTYGDCNVLGNC